MLTYTHVLRVAVLSLGLIFLSSSPINSFAADDSVDLEWVPNSESDLEGYNVYHGTNSGVYGFPDDVKNTTSHHKGNLDPTKRHHFAVTAYDNAGNESEPSAEVSTPPPSVSEPSVATAISSPSAGVTFSPGQRVTVQGQGSNLKWGIDRMSDGKGDFASGTGSTMAFTVPSDANSQQAIQIKLAGTNGNVQQVHKITVAPSVPPPPASSPSAPAPPPPPASSPSAPAPPPPPPASGLTSFTAAHSHKCLEIPGSSQSNGVTATQSSCTGAANQQFQLKSVGTDTFQLVAKHSGKCLDIAGASTANKARLQQYTCHNGNNQRFRLTSSSSTLVAVHSGKCIDVAGRSTLNGAKVQQYACHGGLNQQWAGATGGTTGGNASPPSAPAPPPASGLTSFTVGSGNAYEVLSEGLQTGAVVYTDRGYTFTTIPGIVQDATYLKTANNDKNSQGTSFLSFEVDQSVTVYVAHDRRISPKPAWLNAFTNTGETLGTTDVPLDLYELAFPAGLVTLGGNHDSGTSGSSMYSVVIIGQGGGTSQ